MEFYQAMHELRVMKESVKHLEFSKNLLNQARGIWDIVDKGNSLDVFVAMNRIDELYMAIRNYKSSGNLHNALMGHVREYDRDIDKIEAILEKALEAYYG